MRNDKNMQRDGYFMAESPKPPRIIISHGYPSVNRSPMMLFLFHPTGHRKSSGQPSDPDVPGPTGNRNKSSGCSYRWLKPDKYDGRISVETFTDAFANCAVLNALLRHK